ncbi:MFP1 attachment factor 1-like [Tripterygium wilfordii]|uniref:MFP1 attachment factor 1-like n=1 Tax=Tripterygium wilfordii TaxID=458696 RepID=A0A7J7DKX7_TRIWF|nr:MFP1 attachment factor 1-like [Tripterygium wilfordii]XP_038705091.1 MFP1 attachment factor 1-like [Tripterygium wilfordii]KAF5747020.1 MFP1 attachment factor 1-like [Tripterygium wilfordii]
MADPETSIPTAPAPDQDSKPPAPDQDSKPPAPTVEPEEAQPKDPVSDKHEPKKPSGISLSIWPPSQRTRDAVIARLIETLSSQSVLSKRYGTISESEAQEVARLIEEEAFAVAGGFGSADDDGIEILQVYSKEISKRMLEKVKARAGSVTGSVDAIASQTQSPSEAPTKASEEKSSAETEA